VRIVVAVFPMMVDSCSIKMTRAAIADALGVTLDIGPHKHRALGRVFVGDHPVVIDSRVNYLTILAH
jgi:hypothetical protein